MATTFGAFGKRERFLALDDLGLVAMGIAGVRQAGSTRLASILERFSSNPEKGHRVRVTTAISNRLFLRSNQSILPDIGYRNGSLVDSIMLPS